MNPNITGITLFFNVIILVLFWLISQVAITPAHNLLVQYAEIGADLPILTDFAIQTKSLSVGIPLAWAVITVFIWRWMQKEEEAARTKILALHASLSLCLGLAILLFFSLAGILPVLKIGTVIK